MKKSVLTGLVLIVLGGVLLLQAAGLPVISWGTLLWSTAMALGIAYAAGGWRRTRRGRIFWGVMLAMTAGFALATRIPATGVTSYYIVPWLLLAGGLAMIAAYLRLPRSLHLLVAALAVTTLACAVFLVEFGVIERDLVTDAVGEYWGLVLVLFGAGMLVPSARGLTTEAQRN